MNYLDDIIPSRFSNQNLLNTIKSNILFVDKYIDLVEEKFTDKEEKTIAYKQLGSIVYSCIEATLKITLVEINNRCNNRKCKNSECKYRVYKNNDDISLGSTMNVFLYLLSTRLIGFSTNDIDKIKRLGDLRNYIHISKKINDDIEEVVLDKKYVYSLLDYYYEIVYQIDLADYYFGDDASCLKVIDDNGIAFTKKQIHNDITLYYLLKLYPILHKMFRDEKLSDEDTRTIKAINDKRLVDYQKIADFISKEVSYYRRRFESNEDFRTFLNTFKDSLFIYVKNKTLITLLNEAFLKYKYN